MEQSIKVKGGKISYDNCDNLISITRSELNESSSIFVRKNVFSFEKGELNVITGKPKNEKQ